MSGNNSLTEAQQAVLVRVGAGKSIKETAYDLGISPKTVEFHYKGLRERLNLSTTSDVVNYCAKHKLVVYGVEENKPHEVAAFLRARGLHTEVTVRRRAVNEGLMVMKITKPVNTAKEG